MGSSDSSCCGSSQCPPKPETDSTLLKQNRKRSNPSSIATGSKQEGSEHTVPKMTSSDIGIESTVTDFCNIDAKQLDLEPCSSVSPQPTPQPASSSTEEGNAPYGHHLRTPHGHRNGHKKRKRKKYNRVRTQIEILCSENARAQSLLLCSKPEKIRHDTTVKGFGFLKYLETNLSHNAVTELFNKLPSNANGKKKSADSPHSDQHRDEDSSVRDNVVSETQFVSLLTLIVIIYRIKLHKLRTGTQEKTAVNSEKIRSSIEHLAVWIMRTYGEKLNDRKKVSVYDDAENKIEGEYYVFKWRVSQKQFEENIYQWVEAYVEQEGHYNLTQTI